MDDKTIMMDVLTTEKEIASHTVTAMHEASSENIFNLYSNFFNKLAKEAKEIFAICYANNWYKLEAAQTTKIDDEITKLCQELNKEG